MYKIVNGPVVFKITLPTGEYVGEKPFYFTSFNVIKDPVDFQEYDITDSIILGTDPISFFSQYPVGTIFTMGNGNSLKIESKTIKQVNLSSAGFSLYPNTTVFQFTLPTQTSTTYENRCFFAAEYIAQSPENSNDRTTSMAEFNIKHETYPKNRYVASYLGFRHYSGLFQELKNPSPFPNPSYVSGGWGDHDETNEPVDFPTLPVLSVLNTGFVRAYNPTAQTIQDLCSYLWTSDFVTNLKKIFRDPMESIFGVSIIPLKPSVSDAVPIKIGNVDTSISAPILTTQWKEFDCGTINLNEYWATYMDYTNTTVELYLPFISTQTLSTKDVMGAKLHLKYYIDVLTGSCIAMLKCERENLKSVLYQWTGSCAMQVPVTAQSFTQVLMSQFSTYAAAGSAGIAAGVAAAGASGLSGAVPILAGGAIAAGAAQMNQQEHIQKTGALSGNIGLLSVLQPHLVITRQQPSIPKNYDKLSGYVTNTSHILGELNGFTIIDKVHVDNITGATDAEKSEIENLLKSGVII